MGQERAKKRRKARSENKKDFDNPTDGGKDHEKSNCNHLRVSGYGGVLLTDGWGHGSRKLAAKVFDLNPEEMENRHNQAFDTYELGKLAVEEYLSRVVFYEERPFSPGQFQEFMFVQSKPYPK